MKYIKKFNESTESTESKESTPEINDSIDKVNNRLHSLNFYDQFRDMMRKNNDQFSPEIIKFCVEHTKDVNFGEGQLLRMSIKAGQLDIVKLLIEEYGASDNNNFRQLSTKHAAEYQRWDILEYFLSKGGSYADGFENVMKWIIHTLRISTPSDKIKAILKLQSYIDEDKAHASEKLNSEISEYGSVANYVIQTYNDPKYGDQLKQAYKEFVDKQS